MASADVAYERLGDIPVEDIRAGGAVSLRAIAAELNGRGMLTRRGGR